MKTVVPNGTHSILQWKESSATHLLLIENVKRQMWHLHWSVVTRSRTSCMYTAHSFCIDQLSKKPRVVYVHSARLLHWPVVTKNRASWMYTAQFLHWSVACHKKPRIVYVHNVRLLHWSVVTKSRASCMYTAHGFCIDELSQKAARVKYVHSAALSVAKQLLWFEFILSIECTTTMTYISVVQLVRQKAWPARSKSIETSKEVGFPILWDLHVSKEVHVKPHVGLPLLRQQWREIIAF